MGKISIAIDSGKYETKGVLATNVHDQSKDKTVRFRTSVTESVKDISSFNIPVISFEGKNYIIGEKQQKMNDPNSSKDTFSHKLCIYTAIAKLLNGFDTDNPKIHAVIGCPLDIYTNKERRIRYLNNILPEGKRITIGIDGRELSFTVTSSDVLPESSGIIYLNALSYKNDIVNVIDIGGLNVNGCQFESLKPVISTIFTENLGGNTLCEDLKEALVSLGFERATLADNVLENALRKGNINGIEDGSRLISTLKTNKAQAILKACEGKNWQLKLVNTKFIGGASLLLKNELKDAFKLSDDSFYSDPVFANVKGFIKYLRYR